MTEHRPRLNPREYDQYVTANAQKATTKRVIICSDIHGVFCDQAAWRAFTAVIKGQLLNEDDEIVLNGDVLDFPELSKHTQPLFKRQELIGYSEVNEVELVKEMLADLRHSTDARIVFRLGNHEERVTSPQTHGASQAARLAVLFKHYNTASLDVMLGLADLNIEYDPAPTREYFGIFTVVHGLSLAKNAAEKNIYSYMGSGTSGHSHRLSSKTIANKRGNFAWVESGCLRKIDRVEYMPTAVVADWAQGFCSVVFDISDLNNVTFFARPVPIVNGKCEFNGIVY